MVREATPERTNRRSYNNQEYSRITLKLVIEIADDPREAVLIAFREFIKEMQQADDTLTVLPWKTSSTAPVLTLRSELPDSITSLTKYLFRAYVPKKNTSAILYPQLYVGHDTSFDDIRESMQAWLSSVGQGIYYNMLQAEDAVDIGWLCYSTGSMDAGALADELKDITTISFSL